MTVVDASIVVDFLLGIPPYFEPIAARLESRARSLAAPHLLDAEVAQVLRRHVRSGQLTAGRAAAAFDDLSALPITRYAHSPLLKRAFDFRDNATVYDGLYLALAEALRAPFLTRDEALSAIPGCRAEVEVLG
ncbi:MAG: type II toxin-antitoxin system VapC family toxin [Myxococcales bacterium]|nr:type II toxin-antitoxin system VapC family toxin [Myxococcales bacterium]